MIRHVSRRRKKRGISTVLGILFMVGILFTSVIPLFMYVNEVNNYYDRTVVDLKIADQERSMEDLTVYAFGHNETAIDVFIINSGPISLNITHIWIMRKDLQDTLIFNSTNCEDLPLQLIASRQATIENLTLTPIITGTESMDYFNIEVATERGNKYSSQNNPIHRISSGEWESSTQELQIQVIVKSDWGLDIYLVEVEGVDNSTSGFYDRTESFQLHGDFFTIFSIPKIGSYNVTVNAWQGGGYNRFVGESTAVLTWSHPNALRKFDDTGT